MSIIKDKDIVTKKYQHTWHFTETSPPPESEEVIGFSRVWIDEDFNPSGRRIFFRNETRWHCAFWNDSADSYISLIYDADIESDLSNADKEQCIPEYWTYMIEPPKLSI